MNALLKLIETAASLPGVTVDIKWNDNLVYSVGGKMFVMFSPVHDKDMPTPERFSCKVDPWRFLELTDLPGIEPAPYLARAHWVTVEQPETLPVDFWEVLLADAHRIVAAGLSKKSQRELGLI